MNKYGQYVLTGTFDELETTLSSINNVKETVGINEAEKKVAKAEEYTREAGEKFKKE